MDTKLEEAMHLLSANLESATDWFEQTPATITMTMGFDTFDYAVRLDLVNGNGEVERIDR